MIKGFKKNINSHTLKLADEKIILNISNGNYFSLNEVASTIWDYIQEDSEYKIDEVIYKLLEIYDSSFDQINNDINELLKDLIGQGLIEIA